MPPGFPSPSFERVDTRFFPVVIVRAFDDNHDTPEDLRRMFAALSKMLDRNQPFVTVNDISNASRFPRENIPVTIKWLKENTERRKRLGLAEVVINPSPMFRFVFATVTAAVPVANIRVFPTGAESVPWLEGELRKAGLTAPPGAWAAVRAVGAPQTAELR